MRVCVCVSEGVGGWVCTSVHCVYSPLLTSGALQSETRTGTDSGGSDIILSQKVYGELVVLMSLVRK